MRNKTKTILLPLLALVFAVMFCLSLAPLARGRRIPTNSCF